MLQRFTLFLTRSAIETALRREAPDTIPLSGMDRLRKRNYFTAWLEEEGSQRRFLVKSIFPQGLGGYLFEGPDHGREASIPNDVIPHFKLMIVQYAKEIEVQHRGGLRFYISLWTLSPLRKVLRLRFAIWAFARKKLPRQDRMDVLSWAYGWTLESSEAAPQFNPLTYLIHKHGDFIVFHPEKDRLVRYYRMIFQSLADSGDLKNVDGTWRFSLAPKALHTLDVYEDSDRRHSDSVRHQKYLALLTFALVLTGTGQIIATILNG